MLVRRCCTSGKRGGRGEGGRAEEWGRGGKRARVAKRGGKGIPRKRAVEDTSAGYVKSWWPSCGRKLPARRRACGKSVGGNKRGVCEREGAEGQTTRSQTPQMCR
eukprot:356857-Chlamydomonas_euryale.AAC.2